MLLRGYNIHGNDLISDQGQCNVKKVLQLAPADHTDCGAGGYQTTSTATARKPDSVDVGVVSVHKRLITTNHFTTVGVTPSGPRFVPMKCNHDGMYDRLYSSARLLLLTRHVILYGTATRSLYRTAERQGPMKPRLDM